MSTDPESTERRPFSKKENQLFYIIIILASDIFILSQRLAKPPWISGSANGDVEMSQD